jgi:flavin-dependent dehydrogenase
VTEHADAVVVGARCAGSAAAIALARAGRRVIALDRARFPADTLSTHLLFPAGVAELARLGAYERVEAAGAPPLHEAMVAGRGYAPRASFSAYEGIAHGWCVRRTGMDAALVATAREAGADVREGARVTSLVWARGRVAGVVYEDRDGGTHEIRAPLVVGADGRRSLVARAAGAREPYRSSRNGRACWYAYLEDRRPGWRHVAVQWREGRELGVAFPCDDGLVMVLLMPPVERAAGLGARVQDEYERTIAAIPGLAERVAGARPVTKVRAATDTTSYFRRSSGAGWALAGDAGHFKDPVTAQGIRDALRYGRLLGEAAAPVLDDERALDGALRAWERRRERECLETYQWTNRLGRAEAMTPLEVEMYRSMAGDPDLTRSLLDVFTRLRTPSQVAGPRRGLALTARALARRGADRGAILRRAGGELRAAAAEWLERERALRSPLPPLPGPPERAAAPRRDAEVVTAGSG